MNDNAEPESFGVETCVGEAKFVWLERPSTIYNVVPRWYLADCNGEIRREIYVADGKYIVIGGKSYITLDFAKKSVRLDMLKSICQCGEKCDF